MDLGLWYGRASCKRYVSASFFNNLTDTADTMEEVLDGTVMQGDLRQLFPYACRIVEHDLYKHDYVHVTLSRAYPTRCLQPRRNDLIYRFFCSSTSRMTRPLHNRWPPCFLEQNCNIQLTCNAQGRWAALATTPGDPTVTLTVVVGALLCDYDARKNVAYFQAEVNATFDKIQAP